jgi:outer membrane protein assembly factor BamB
MASQVGLRALIVWTAATLAASLPVSAANYISYAYGPRHEGFTDEKIQAPLSLAWRFVTAPREYSGTAPLVVDNNVFHAAGYALYCLDVANGSIKWAVMTKAPVRSAPAYCRGLVWFGDDEGKLRAVDPQTGKVAWELDAQDAIRSPIVAAGSVILFGTTGSKIFAVDAEKHERLWQARTSDRVDAAPAADERAVYVACLDNSVYSFDLKTGNERWQLKLGSGWAIAGAPVLSSNFIYLAAGKSLLVIGKYGRLVNQAAFKGDLAGEPALTNSGLYVAIKGAGNAAVYCVTEQPFRKKWETPLDISPAAPLTVTPDLVLVGGSYGLTAALSVETGKMVWSYLAREPDSATQDAEFKAQAAPIVANGRLYMIYDDGSLCCFAGDAPDVTPPAVTRLTPAAVEPVSALPPVIIGANVYDEGSGVDPSSIKMTYDGKDVKWEMRFDNSDCYYEVKAATDTTPIENGWHTVTVSAADWRGNAIEKKWRFLCDRSIAQPTKTTKTTTPAGGGAVPTGGFRAGRERRGRGRD